MTFNLFTAVFLALFVLHRGFELWLDGLQLRYLLRRPNKVPEHLEGKVDLETVQKAVAYNTHKLHFGIVSKVLDAAAIWIMVLWGFALLERAVAAVSLGPLASGLVFFGLLFLLSEIFGLPFDLYGTFVVETKHGFNRSTIGAFFIDRIKALIINLLFGAGLLSLVLLLMEKGGARWWLYAFFAVSAVQLVMLWIYPLVIMPWFNKFTPVPDDLAEDVAALAGAVRFPLKQVFSMDGSRRSAHANAFIIGLTGARKIVLFDTLIEKVSRAQLLAVLAHELGHFKLGHLPKRMALTLVSMFALFFGIAVLRETPAVYPGLGFSAPSDAAAVVVFSLLIAEIAAPFGFLMRILSRRDEYAADRFAVETVQNGDDLADALIALKKQNLSSPGSHKWYRAYHNSHPALRDRLAAIRKRAETLGP